MELEFEAWGQDRVSGYNPNNRNYDFFNSSSTATLRTLTRDPLSTVTYEWIVNGTSIEAGEVGVGGGNVVLNVPAGQSTLRIAVRAAPPETAVGAYFIDINPPCTPGPAECDDGNSCTTDVCDALDSTCGFTLLADGDVCDFNTAGDGVCAAVICAKACGNGDLNTGENCDQGALNGTGDGFCLADCSGTQSCGDGAANGTEGCDDGVNNGAGDGFCLTDCSAMQICGDTIANGGEDCDEGAVDTMLCDADCTLATCGDGYINGMAGEQCDDGNTTDGDGCSSTCMDAPVACGLDLVACSASEGCYPTTSGAFCFPAGSLPEDDPCVNQNDCQAGYACIDRQVGPPGALCTELCDTANGFNCSSGGPCSGIAGSSGLGACEYDPCDPLDVLTCDPGLACYPTSAGPLCLDAGTTGVGSTCLSHTDCVAGTWCVDPGTGDVCALLCDPANGNADCSASEVCTALVSDPTIGACEVACGNGDIDPGEACDDGVQNGTGDGFCLVDCSATQICGDGIQNGTEACDDDVDNGAGEGFCVSDCSATQICGDTIANGTEDCDDGAVDTISCDFDCTSVICGDGYLNGPGGAGEECDDGNTVDGDGCSSTCMITEVACGLDLATCSASEGCYPTATGAFCKPAGSTPEDGSCTMQNDCETGYGCIDRQVGPAGSFCTELCDTANGFNCSSGGPCSAISGASGFGACEYDPCNPLDVLTCDPLLACYPTSAGPLCLDAGTTGVGGTCSTHTDCVAGTWCVNPGTGDICMLLCDPANGNADCSAGQSCFPLSSDPTIGVCF